MPKPPTSIRMRFLIILTLLASPASAWEFSSRPICTLTHETPEVAVKVTFDPRIGEYAIALTRSAGWPAFPLFAMRFDGPRGLTISTSRHMLDGGTLTVTDRGFGNVLNGLEFNETVLAMTGEDAVTIPLSGAAPAVREFRACATAPTA